MLRVILMPNSGYHAPEIKHWIPVLVVSLLLHLLVLTSIDVRFQTITSAPTKKPIELVLIKSPAQQAPISKSAKRVSQASADGTTRKNPVVVPSRKDMLKTPTSHAEKSPANKKNAAMPAASPKIEAHSSNKQTAKQAPKRDWNNIAKEMIRDNADQEIRRDQRQGELWLKSPSVMFGKSRDYFDKQDKRAMLTDINEHKPTNIFPTRKQKSESKVIKIGKLCFHRPTFDEEQDIRAGASINGMMIPENCEE